MRESNAYPNSQKQRRWLSVLLTLCSAMISLFAHAQQQSSSGAVETFEPAFEVAIAQYPRAGLYGITELMMAALEADIPKARQLIDEGADVNETDNSQSTPLMWAVHSGDINIVKFFVSNGANVRAKAYQGATALMNAITQKQEAIAVVLIDAGADPNGRGNSARNFLETAAESGMTDVVEALIRNGTDLTIHGSSALSYAVSRGHKEAAVMLLDAGIDANAEGPMSGYSNLYRASATGDLDLVKLLISRGANANPPSDFKSPLNPAASQGHTAIAELLIDNGAVLTVQHVLSATRSGHVDTAIAFLNKLDIEEFERVEIESLLAAANDLGNEVLIQRLLDSPSVKFVVDEAARLVELQKQAAMQEHSRLLFARQAEDHCVIGVWSSRSGVSSELADIAKCPEDVFVSTDRRSAYVIDDEVIRVVSTDESTADTEIPLPDLDYRGWLDQMTLRPDQNPDYLPSITAMKPIGIGDLEDGSLGLLLSLWMPADDAYHYMFRYDDGQWSIADARWCDRWGCESSIGSTAMHSTNVWSWPESRMIWHNNISLNPFFSEKSVEMVDLEYERYQAATHQREFKIDGALATLSAFTRPSEHSDTNHTLGINLSINGNPPKELSGNQCLTSIVGRFILVYEFFQGRFEVTDIGTGTTVIGDLKAAMWLD